MPKRFYIGVGERVSKVSEPRRDGALQHIYGETLMPLIRTQGGAGNKWQTPNQKARQAAQIEQGTMLGVGDAGIWATYARGQRPRAVREFIDLCEEVSFSPCWLFTHAPVCFGNLR